MRDVQTLRAQLAQMATAGDNATSEMTRARTNAAKGFGQLNGPTRQVELRMTELQTDILSLQRLVEQQYQSEVYRQQQYWRQQALANQAWQQQVAWNRAMASQGYVIAQPWVGPAVYHTPRYRNSVIFDNRNLHRGYRWNRTGWSIRINN